MKSFTAILIAAFLSIAPFSANAHDQLHELGDLKWMLTYGMLQSAFAKELCSCRFVAGLTLDQCEDHLGLPQEALSFVSIDETAYGGIVVRPTTNILSFPYNASATATFNSEHPQLGCRITSGMIELLYPDAP